MTDDCSRADLSDDERERAAAKLSFAITGQLPRGYERDRDPKP